MKLNFKQILLLIAFVIGSILAVSFLLKFIAFILPVVIGVGVGIFLFFRYNYKKNDDY